MTANTYNFDALTEAQRNVLHQIAFGNDGGHNPRTLKALEDRRLIIPYHQTIGDPPFRVKITRYAMEIAVHIAWCEWCSENCDE